MLLVEGGSFAGVAEGPRADPLAGSAYRVVRRLGAGGMGEVFEAEHRALGHRVVVKMMREELSEREEMLDRVRVEAQSLARIRHPNLVMVTDLGRTRSGQPFIVMERLAGRSLHEELHARSTLPAAEAAEIGRQMLLGLSVAHEAGLVHRDIKPDNVFLCESDDGRPRVKVLDFGVVKIAQAGRDPRTPEPPVIPTAENIALGTPRYFSPEQARTPSDLDARSDLYSVGLVLYAMLVGHGPFDHHRRLRDVLDAHATEAPLPPSAAASQPVPAALDRLVMRALAKRREDRPQTALAFAEELSRFLSTLGAEGHRVNAAVRVPEEELETIEEEDREPTGEPTAPETETARDGPRGAADSPLAATRPEGARAAAPERGDPAGAEDPTVTASPVAPPKRAVGKLPDGPVMIDHLVSRVLGSAPPPPRPSAPGGTAPRMPEQAVPPGAVRAAGGGTAPMVPVQPGRVARGAMGGTDPMVPVQPGGMPVRTAPLGPDMAALARGPAGQNAVRAHVPPPRPSSPEPTVPDVAPGRASAPSLTEPMPAGSVPAAAASGPGRLSQPGVPDTAPMFEVGAGALIGPAADWPAAAALPAPRPAASGGWKVSSLAAGAALLVFLGAMIGYLLAR